ncbi:sulfatase-like hydrolase/transferase [Tardiphaga sp.]|uniref:sulfatase-like hydrolase/transferase n=1 Tax=Tardiphaga sp. TaxID=1926292 RepID=UPI002612AF1C|nr:sulfatase-like hydrolase/transferase [Tardiphaga sp.]MDB5619750.1 sulfatase [Tardiphaga sp.]
MIGRFSRSYLLLLSAFTLAVTLTFFPVVKAELQNPVTFPIAFIPLLLAFAGLAVLLTLLITGCEGWVRPQWRRGAVVANIALALLAWIKGSVILWDYGSLMGNTPDWQAYSLQGAIDIALCAAIAIAFALGRRWIFRKATTICAFLCLAQALHMVWLSPAFSERTFAELMAKETLETTEKHEEIVSTTSNVVVIILDTFQSDVFADLLARQPALAQELPGFRYFADTASAFPYTLLSVPSVLTGEDYLNQVPYAKYQSESYSGPNSIMKRLMDDGYYVELDRWGLATPIPNRSALASNLVRTFFPDLETTVSMQLFALYTIAPQFLKQMMFRTVSQVGLDATDTIDNNLTFIRNLLTLPTKRIDRPVAKIIHLKGPHIPLQRYEASGFDYFAAARNGETKFKEAERTRANYTAVAEQSIRGVVGYMKRLRDAGVYDRSNVFVFGDHGAGLQGQAFVAPPAWNIPAGHDMVASALRVAALPLLIVKQAGATGPLQTVATPVSLSNLNCTMRRLLPAYANDSCFSLFDPKAMPPASRLFYSTIVRFDPQGYFPTFKAFEINGPVWNDESWRASPIQYLSRNRLYRIPPYKPDEIMTFGRNGNADDYQSFGWGDPGEGFAWTIGRRADLTVPLAGPTSQPLMLVASLSPFLVPGRLESQTVNVYANDEKLATWMVGAAGQYKAAVPSRIAASDRLDLRFDLPDATSPFALGLSKDDLSYGVQVQSAVLRNTAYEIGDTIRFGQAGIATDYQSAGWGTPGDGFTWTVGKQSSLELPLPTSTTQPLMLEVLLAPLQVPGKVEGQTIKVYANGEKITEWHATHAGKYRAAIPSRLVASGRIDLRFDLPDAKSPAELGLGEDRSRLGMQVESVALRTVAYRTGDIIAFGQDGNAADFQSGGWNQPSAGFTWSSGKQTSLVIPLQDSAAGALTLQVSLTPWLVPGKVERQTVNVFANGEKIAEWIATASGRYKAQIPARLTASGVIKLSFALPDATSPAQLGISSDPALYAVQMQSITFGSNPYVPGDTVTFGRDGNSKRFQSGGWGDPQAGFTWTVGHQSSLDMQLANIPTESLTLKASLIPFVVPGKLERQTVVVYVNNEKINEWSVSAAGEFEADIPARLVESGNLDLRFDLPEATSQVALGLNDDPTVFAVQVHSLTLR